MGGRASRQKGRRWELDFIKLADKHSIPAVRFDQYEGEAVGGKDVMLYAIRQDGRVKIFSKGYYPVECKNNGKLGVPNIARLCVEDPDRLVAVKVDRVGSFVAVESERFLRLVSELEKWSPS